MASENNIKPENCKKILKNCNMNSNNIYYEKWNEQKCFDYKIGAYNQYRKYRTIDW